MSKHFIYFPKIDSLRTIAVAMVLLVHFLPDAGWRRIPYMDTGVDLFFTISGFLITSILLKAKESNIELGGNKLSIIFNFITRRALRLFPIYYLFLIALIIVRHITNVWLWHDGDAVYYFTYTANFLFYNAGKQSSLLNHLWSLSVEEQFYIIWPWIVVFLNKKILKYIILLFILCGLSCHIFIHTAEMRMLPFSNLHTLGIGALLAFNLMYNSTNQILVHISNRKTTYCCVFIALYIFFTQLIDRSIYSSGILFFGKEFSLILATSSLVLIALNNSGSNLFDHLLNNKLAQYFGKISYGIYLYHKPIPFFINIFLTKIKLNVPSPILFISYLLFTITISALSYRYIEQYFLKLKEKFEK